MENHEVVTVKGKAIFLLSVQELGTTRVSVKVRDSKVVKVGKGTQQKTELIPVGPVIEGVGGFKAPRYYDYSSAKQLALEVAVSRIGAANV
jgi:hypothetical protein